MTGCSGSLGKQLLYTLTQMGVKPIAHARESSDTSFAKRLGLEVRYADLRIRPELKAIVKDVDAVIHTAAIVDFRKGQLTQFTGTNTMGALDLYRVSAKAGVKRFVQVSTVAAIGGCCRKNRKPGVDAESCNEQTEYNLQWCKIPYFMTKRAAEDELLKESKQGGPELVIVNPSIMIAPSADNGDYARVKSALNKKILPRFTNYVNLVDVRDVAVGVVSALSVGRSGERYILGGDNITIRDLALDLSALVDRAPHLFNIPRPVLEFSAWLSSVFGALVGRREVKFYPEIIKLLDFDWAYSSMKARDELGYRPRSIFISLENLLTGKFGGSYVRR